MEKCVAEGIPRDMFDGQAKIGEILGRLRSANASGFAIGLHLQFAAPRYLFQAYAPDWTEFYSRNGYLLRDPVVRWSVANVGAIRWSDLERPTDDPVMPAAAAHGLRYGFALSIMLDGSHSVGAFARPDREANEEEIEAAKRDLAELHRLTAGLTQLTPGLHAALKRLSIDLTRR